MRCTGGSAQKGSNELEPIIRIEQLTHTYSAGTPFQRSAVDGVEPVSYTHLTLPTNSLV